MRAKKPLYQAVFTAPPNKRKARTAVTLVQTAKVVLSFPASQKSASTKLADHW